jgi:hypothetical protein
MIYCEIFSMIDQQKNFLWKISNFIRLSIKIVVDGQLLIIFCD